MEQKCPLEIQRREEEFLYETENYQPGSWNQSGADKGLAAVFIGRSVGGAERPNALGTVVGALLISTLENGLTMCGVVYYVLPAVKGAVLCLALVAAYITVKED